MDLNTDWKEFLESFVSNEVEYLVVGAVAVALHGHPRLTGDLDVWIRPTLENAQRVRSALDAFGMSDLDASPGDFIHPETVIQIGFPPRRIDVLTFCSGLEFEAAWQNRAILELDGVQVSVLGLEDLITNKRTTGRLQDIADVSKIERGSSTPE